MLQQDVAAMARLAVAGFAAEAERNQSRRSCWWNAFNARKLLGSL